MIDARSYREWRIGRALMLISALTYGPLPSIIDSFDPGHLTNPTWPGHARLHLLWLIFLCLYGGSIAAYLAYRATPERQSYLTISAAIGGVLLGAFFSSGLVGVLVPAVGAEFGEPEQFLGPVPINVIHLSISTLLLVVGYWLCRRAGRALQAGRAA